MNMTAHYPTGEPHEVEQQMAIVDHRGYCYAIFLSYSPEDAQKYEELFDSIIETFNIVR